MFSLNGKMTPNKFKLDQETISCSICLDLLKEPVTIPCGHSYCMSCINTHWNAANQKKVQSCPQCRQNFTPRPALVKSTTLAALVEELENTKLHDAPVAGPEDVSCDVCTGRKLKAVKSCLVCLASYCEEHLQPHHNAPPLQKHRLVDPYKRLQENICSLHDEVMKIFCRTDQQCICYLCSVDAHKGHETISAEAERAEKQTELEGIQQQIQQQIQERETELELLQKEMDEIDASAEKTVEDTKKLFKELIRLMKNRRSDVKKQVRSQQKTEVCRVEELHQKLEQEIIELKKKGTELEQLSNTEDHNQFLNTYRSVSPVSESPFIPSRIPVHPLRFFQDVTSAVSELRDKLVDVTSSTPIIRADFLLNSQELTFDPDTANSEMLLSEENKRATYLRGNPSYPEHPGRFTHYCQVLSRESLGRRSYWEVEWSGGGVCIAAAYKYIRREGTSAECAFGFSNLSWALSSTRKGYKFDHALKEVIISGPRSSRIGVFLDHSAGTLCFYSVSETMTLLHRVQTSFTQSLYAGVRLYNTEGDTAEFITLK